MSLALAVAILSFSPRVVGFSTFTPNCTASNVIANYVADTGHRSTLDILWSSLFTIIACTWTILHLNVPEQRNGRDPGFWGDAKWALKGMGRNVMWMAITILAPELTLGLAATRLEEALSWKRTFKEMATMDDVEYTLTHAFYSAMGGFAISVSLPDQVGQPSESGNGEVGINLANITLPEAAPETRKEESKRVANLHLTSGSLYTLRERGYIKKLPSISTDQINDRSKSDMFTKIIAAIQVFSSIAQVIVRHSRRLPISQLELAVCAFSVCAMITYLLVLYQPKGVQTVEVISNDGENLPLNEAVSICNRGREKTIRSSNYYSNGEFDEGIPDLEGEFDGLRAATFIALAGIIFGGIHCCGWFFIFPTDQELLLWRICSITTTATPLLLLTLATVSPHLGPLFYTVLIRAVVVLMLIYVMARLYIIVEIFRSLFYLPPDAFISTWTNNIAQIS